MLKIEHLKKVFNPGTINEKVVFEDFNLDVDAGDFITIIGSNGAGKSTLLNLICGTINPDGGRMIVNDSIDITFEPEIRTACFVGRVFQDPMMGTAPDMWISENLALANRRGKRHGLKWGMPKEEEENMYKELLAGLGLGLENRLHTKVGMLSGGQRQAVTLLMAAMQDPALLVLDEHTAALDPKTAATVLEISDRIIREKNLTALMVTHNMQNAIDYGNRLIMMHQGKVVLDIKGEEKKKLTVPALMDMFEKVSGAGFASDEALLH